MVTRTEAERDADRVTDAELVRASWDAPDRFGALYDRHVNALFGYACLRVGATAAEDVVADTFLAAFAQRRRYDLGRGSARAWLFGILSKKISDRGRGERVHYRALARIGEGRPSDELDQRIADQVSAQAMRGHLADALGRLGKADRHVLLLVAWGELSYDEVAQALGIPVGTVASRLNRARRKVRQTLAELESGNTRTGDRHG